MLIVNFGQVVDLEAGGQFAHQFTVQMLDGRRAAVTTDERTIQQLIELIGGAESPEVARPGSNGQTAQEREQVIDDSFYEAEPEGVEFGGDYDPGEDHHERAPVMGAIAEEPAAALPPQVGGLGQAPAVPVQQPRRPNLDGDGFLVPPRARTVPSDSAGYPVVPQTNAPPQPSVGHLGKYAEDDDDGTQI